MRRSRVLQLLLVLVVVAAATVSAAGAATRPPFRDPCGTKAERTHAVVFRAPGGPRLVGLLLGNGKTGVVLAHELRANLCRWLPFARVLARSGYRVLAFDFSGHGSSGLPNRTSGGIDAEVVAAGRLLVGRGAGKLVVVGASMGGTAAIVAASQLGPELAGVASLSGPAEFGGLDAAATVAQLTVPSLFVAGADDAPFADDARALYDAAPGPDKQLELVPGSAHGTSLLAGPGGGRERSLLLAFVRARAGRLRE
jgi:pimeloyl-ACP methyl ester carboxylesterase